MCVCVCVRVRTGGKHGVQILWGLHFKTVLLDSLGSHSGEEHTSATP